jgi:cell division topological specificity factor
MRLFSFLRPISSAPVARERLQILLEYERKLVSQSDLIAILREEILAVVARHVTIDPDNVQIRVDRGTKASILAVDIEIPNTSLATASLWSNSNARTQFFSDNAMKWSR